MKRYLSLLSVLIFVFSGYAQHGYWFQNDFIELTPSRSNRYYIQLRNSATEHLTGLQESLIKKGIKTSIMGEGLIVESDINPDIVDSYVSNIYYTRDSKKVIVLPRISLRLKEGWDISTLIHDYSSLLSVRKGVGRLYSLCCNCSSSDEVLKLSERLYNHPAIVWCEPAKYSEFRLGNSKYPQQYYLKNTGQTGGVADMDINVEDAWEMVAPKTSITVAVIDTGVEHYHEDLSETVLNGYTVGSSSGNGEPANEYSDYDKIKAHGTTCAGIIAANDNTIGIKGVAYDIPILPINIVPFMATSDSVQGFAADDDIADAIRWAFQRADILSCSWGGGAYSQAIADAINDARSFGRDGKGTIVVFASGNDYLNNSTSVNFPSVLDGVISVGALNKYGSVCDYSQRGQGLTLMAFGGESDIVTTDRMWALGFTSSGDWNYVTNLSGTSYACPQVAGVVALMLSANPFLTEVQVREILQATCRKLSGYTYIDGWSNQVGYGLIDAGAAVQASFIPISGPDIPCGSAIYSIVNMPDSCTVSWEWQGNALDQSDSPTITPNSPNAYSCTIANNYKAYLKGNLVATISKNGIPMTISKKAIDTGANFSGTYEQEAIQYGTWYHPGTTATTFHSGDSIILYKKGTITLNSQQFIGATITWTGNTPLDWTNSNGVITFHFKYLAPFNPGDPIHSRHILPSNEAKLVVTGKYPNSCETFQFTVKGYDPGELPLPISSIYLDVESEGYTFYFMLNHTDCLKMDGTSQDDEAQIQMPPWQLTILNATTGKIQYNECLSLNSTRVDTSKWKSGTYIVQARAGNETLTRKIMIH